MNAKHTPAPWIWEEGSPDVLCDWSGRACIIARVVDPVWHEDRNSANDEAGANAAHIVRCVNAHDDLVTQLKGVIAAFRCVISSLDIDEDETTLNISASSRAIAQVPIATLLANANEALAKAEASA